jgi:hypothetical protein
MGTATTVARGMRMIEEGFLDREPVASLSAALGVGSRATCCVSSCAMRGSQPERGGRDEASAKGKTADR